MKKKYKIVIIDTGIDLFNKYLPINKIDGVNIERDINNCSGYKILSYKDNPTCIQDNIGHGTAISGIILIIPILRYLLLNYLTET